MNGQDRQSLRIDKWLWFTRFYKTRVLAAKAVAGGHVKLNNVRARPSSAIAPGDVIDLVRDQLPYCLVACDLPLRRGPAVEARRSYTEDDASIKRREELSSDIRRDRMQMPRTDGKPDKHTRRKLRQRPEV
jgi:ribosome-associated heat shock protein Hsp15